MVPRDPSSSSLTSVPSVPSLSLGRIQRVGRYELLGRIASGGMATVYLGRSVGARGFSRLVAIKKLHPNLESSHDIVTMFFEEARLAARIRHPNVVPTLDIDEQDGLCIVMEYVEGDQLLGLLRAAAQDGGRVPLPIALRIALDFLAGLHEAHELCDEEGLPLNIVHRDVSPHNILVGIDGITKLTDFGIARADSRDTITRDGELKGKIAYMAPEQASGFKVDRRADVFASGVVLWELFTSERLFVSGSSVATLSQLLHADVEPLTKFGFDEGLSRAVDKALERDVTRRWQSAAELAEALEAAAPAAGGIATTRQVAEYVRRVSGEKIASERARLKTDSGEADRSSRFDVIDVDDAGASAVGHTLPTSSEPSRVRRRLSYVAIALVLGALAAITFSVTLERTRAAAVGGAALSSSPSIAPDSAAAFDGQAATLITPPVLQVPALASPDPSPPPTAAPPAATPPSSARPRPRAATPRHDEDSIAPNPYHH